LIQVNALFAAGFGAAMKAAMKGALRRRIGASRYVSSDSRDAA
jgi:hypothetical protein